MRIALDGDSPAVEARETAKVQLAEKQNGGVPPKTGSGVNTLA